MFCSILDHLKGLYSSLRFKNRWNAPQGYRELLNLAVPLVLSNIASSLMMFTDRVFLSHYSLISLAAALPSGIMLFLLQSLFFGLVTYAGIFAAQYVGAGKPRRAASALWQGLYFSLLVGFLLYILFFFSEDIFQLAKHDPEVIKEETLYFNTLLTAGPLALC
ncbi:MAG: hypothetical protein LBF22_06310, partial [Deltaproteobacteria bacterium]|nr:hypothetical protein [Deltaproteobacteria bacterium]